MPQAVLMSNELTLSDPIWLRLNPFRPLADVLGGRVKITYKNQNVPHN